ncbi:hypothetical protein [Microbacterium aurum]
MLAVTGLGVAFAWFDATSAGAATTAPVSPSDATADAATTDGADGILGGTQLALPLTAPVTAGGNAVAIVGDAATTGPTTGPVSPTDRTDPTGPTDPTDPGTPGTPGTSVTPAGSGGGSIVGTAASVGSVTALAETGGALSAVPLWAGLLVLAAGVMLIARSTTRARARGRTY